MNPYNGQVLKTFKEMSSEEVSDAIAKAYDRFKSWRRVSFAERGAMLRRSRIVPAAAGRPGEAHGDRHGQAHRRGPRRGRPVRRIFDYYAENGERFLKPQLIPSPAGDGTLLNQPLGVILGIEPWNYPFYQVVRFAAPNLMAGNTILLKHASNVQQCAEAAEALFRDAGFPVGSYTNLVISSRLIPAVIDDDRVQGVSFTGSDAAGPGLRSVPGRTSRRRSWNWAAAIRSSC